MKFTEGLGATMAAYLKKALDGKVSTSDLEPLASKIWEVNNLPRKMGGPLFGVNGVTIVGHGASMAEGVAGAINTATRAVKLNLVDGIRTELAALQNGLPQAERP
jgi:fatty acid/phospholipid biosynthesis enzyme